MHSSPGGLRIETRVIGPGLHQLAPEWDSLLERSTRPTIYSCFDYLYTACSHLQRDEEIFFLVLRDSATGELRAIFPISVWEDGQSGVRSRRIEHGITTHNTLVDKPYPIIERNREEECWHAFGEFFRKDYLEWDVIVYEELLPESYLLRGLNRLFPCPGYRTEVKPGPESPMVRLDADWDEFWQAHPNLRKKDHRLKRRIGQRLSYRVTGDPDDVRSCLDQYIATERVAGRSDIVTSHHEFYRDLLPKLAAKQRLFFGTLYDGETVISTEISFVFLDRVFFAHGVYDPVYHKLSPGTVSTSRFLRFFHHKHYLEGDFLAGFALYIRPWASRIDKTAHITIRRTGAGVRRFRPPGTP